PPSPVSAQGDLQGGPGSAHGRGDLRRSRNTDGHRRHLRAEDSRWIPTDQDHASCDDHRSQSGGSSRDGVLRASLRAGKVAGKETMMTKRTTHRGGAVRHSRVLRWTIVAAGMLAVLSTGVRADRRGSGGSVRQSRQSHQNVGANRNNNYNRNTNVNRTTVN